MLPNSHIIDLINTCAYLILKDIGHFLMNRLTFVIDSHIVELTTLCLRH